ncbi:DUF2973 domain-containing protein [Cronbergia sp. UHCC 0137]|uniref:DUF2973 domain-containing protein n=1 Tax=Cronbergia sp. UHCC 0137 TaxID=3110239 RepID=UPI002B202F50|nr:DUF2973 domain-containing protein [Cronbergia sp. UHCC 0137]MEA5617764.1 DUF2973 domain-containing protein [Cronbergia sp. UHCC 0137]
MLHLLYILAFTVLALIAVVNLIRNLIMFSFDQERTYPAQGSSMGNKGGFGYYAAKQKLIPHPELLDSAGNVIKEPLLVMRSISVEDARQQLDALYQSSPGQRTETQEGA